MEQLRGLGFAPRIGAHTQTRGPLFFAGSADERLADLHAAFADPETAIVAAVRGGYGSGYLLEGLDLALIESVQNRFSHTAI